MATRSNKAEIERLLRKYPGPRDVRYAPQLEGRGSELKNQFPGTYGFLGGLMGTVPDEFERGSVLSDDERTRDEAVTKGAEYGYPLSVMANAAPLLSGIGGLAAKYGPGIAKAAARNASAPATLSKQAGVIKAPGGNWLSGSVEDALKGLKKERRVFDLNELGGLEAADKAYLESNFGSTIGLPEPDAARVRAMLAPGDSALNSWIDKQLTRYVKNDMATERDPIRALAERGVLHYDPHGFDTPRLSTQLKRQTQKYFAPEDAVKAKSDIARRWENASDSAVAGTPMAEYQDFGSSNLTREHPWIAKLDPESTMFRYDSGTSAGNDLGFNHLIDELRNATNPQSGLPADLLLKYDALDKVSVPQAVERVAKINEWRAAQKAEADMARANNAAAHVFKEYPDNNPQGLRWVELKAPRAKSVEDLSPEQMSWYDEYVHGGVSPEKALQEASKRAQKTLADALKYEGDTMGHCVGGYCDEVASGKSRIFSLRDAKGQPHVTIETAPGSFGGTDRDGFIRRANELGWSPEKLTEHMAKLDEASAFEPTIIQIKGKANRAPNPEYLPFVQDFVKSGKWSDVGDFGNTGLKRLKDFGDEPMIKAAREKFGDYVTPEEWDSIMNPKLGFAQGGAVKAPHPCGCEKGYAEGGFVQYDPTHIDSLVEQLRAEFA